MKLNKAEHSRPMQKSRIGLDLAALGLCWRR
jgi:hypothetical protein